MCTEHLKSGPARCKLPCWSLRALIDIMSAVKTCFFPRIYPSEIPQTSVRFYQSGLLFWKMRADVLYFVSAYFTTSDGDEADRGLSAQIKLRSATETLGDHAARTVHLLNARLPWILPGSVSCSPPDKLRTKHSYHGNTVSGRSDPWIYTVLMETMSPQQGTMGQNRSDSLTGDSKAPSDNKKVPVTPLCGTSGDDAVLRVCALTRCVTFLVILLKLPLCFITMFLVLWALSYYKTLYSVIQHLHLVIISLWKVRLLYENVQILHPVFCVIMLFIPGVTTPPPRVNTQKRSNIHLITRHFWL